MSNDGLHASAPSLISKRNRKLLDEYVQKYKTPISRLVAIAIEHELEKEKPFTYDISLPDDEYIPEAYVDEAGRIIDYMKKTSGMSLDDMCLMRYDMGIPDKKTFLLAFRECLNVKQLEAYKPRQPAYAQVKYADDFVFYRVIELNQYIIKKTRRKPTEYELLQKLKKKFGEI